MIQTIGFTGSEPNKLWGYSLQHPKYIILKERLRDEIINIMNNSDADKFHFICGGALGFDTLSAQVILLLKEEFKNQISLEIAVPYKDQPNKWFSKVDVDMYNLINSMADFVTEVDRIENYQRTRVKVGLHNSFKLQLRNEYIVDKSNLLIALYDGSKGGTHNCVTYAKKRNKNILIINPKEI
ncbi:MAG: SLOG family protein [Clostridium sp.]|uniref:SLOG family protein n=1 Tax=Clostridium sp. TaxID=1506 RepID=UPI003F3EE367